MVIEVSKECDVVRIGIDRYSLKTGLNLRTIMDLSLRVLKEPRGFIRVLQCIMAILAFSTTAGFNTECAFSISCGEGPEHEIDVEYEFGYPFSHTELEIPDSCDAKDNEFVELELPFNFANVSQFFVATGVLSFLYTICILIVYIFFHQTYANNNKVPVVDLVMTIVLAIFWMAGSSAWAQGVTDMKYYLHPETLFKFLPICVRDRGAHDCTTSEEGTYGVLNASLILGFANFLLWASSLWFVYKETMFHTPEIPPEPVSNQNTLQKGMTTRSVDLRKV